MKLNFFCRKLTFISYYQAMTYYSVWKFQKTCILPSQKIFRWKHWQICRSSSNLRSQKILQKKKNQKNKKQNQKTLQSTVATTLVNAFSWRKAHWRVPCSQEFQPTEAAGQVKGSTQCKTLNSRQAPLAWVLCHALEKGYFKVVLIHSCQQLPNKI